MAETPQSKLTYVKKSAWEGSADREKTLMRFAEEYKTFMSACKTERACVRFTEAEALKKGFVPLEKAKGTPGEKIFIKNGQRNILLVVLGKQPAAAGVNLIASHIDSPRLDLKPLPLIEDSEMALLKTHYYGGIKKYQWLNIPLAIHGTVVRADGSSIDIVIGEKADDPVFTINDLLPHLAAKPQGEKKLLDGIEGESLRVLIGSRPMPECELKEKVKEMALQKLSEQYGMVEEDFLSSELEIVPAFPARDVGLDRSMVGAYGQDDRVCSYAAYRAVLDLDTTPERTAVAFLVDKEEIGSYGVTGIRSRFFYNAMGDLLGLQNKDYREQDLRKMMEKSFCLSGDVGAVINPMYKDVFDSENDPKIGYGMILEKYTGSRGKSGTSDASAELMGKIRLLLNQNAIVWQPSTLGKVDQGGGGTVALYMADLGMPVVDAGVGVDGMHSPFEVVSKADLYEMLRGFTAFLKDA